jgi:putative metalloprotease
MAGLIAIIVATVVIGYIQFRVGMAALMRQLDEKSRPLQDDALEALVARLGRVVELPGLKAHLFDMPVVNGLATPDGRIFITTALFDKYRLGILKAEEVASVVAHELGHVALGHHTRRLIDWTGQSAARMALGLLLNRFLPIIGFWIANVLAALAMARLSRRDEFEADRYATALMLKAGLSHEAQIAMFRKLEKMAPAAGGQGGAAWLASHPPVQERVAAIEENVAAWREGAQQGGPG